MIHKKRKKVKNMDCKVGITINLRIITKRKKVVNMIKKAIKKYEEQSK